MKNAIGQCYDGAANMSGCKQGLAVKVLRENSKALFVHCHGHRLNLALKDASNRLPYILETTAMVNSVYDFVEGSAQRHALFKHVQGDQRAITLKHLCETRWGDKKFAYDAHVEVYSQILLFLNVNINLLNYTVI